MQAPILMIHGMCCTGDIWAHFRSYFEARGAVVYTPTLRPHQRVHRRAVPPHSLGELRLLDYLEDLEREIDRIEHDTGETPAILGHSMGGLLAQALVERDRACAAVFISPSAPADVKTPSWAFFWQLYKVAKSAGLTHGKLRMPRPLITTMALNAVPKPQRDALFEAMRWESGSVFSDFAHFPVDESKFRVPVLTVATSKDRLIWPSLVRRMANKYANVGGEYREYPDHGHWLPEEPGWELVAADIYSWLRNAIVRGQSVRDTYVRKGGYRKAS